MQLVGILYAVLQNLLVLRHSLIDSWGVVTNLATAKAEKPLRIPYLNGKAANHPAASVKRTQWKPPAASAAKDRCASITAPSAPSPAAAGRTLPCARYARPTWRRPRSSTCGNR
jgi:hypothetical protein